MDGIGKIKDINNVEEDEMILDIGPKTIDSIKKTINNSNTVLAGLQELPAKTANPLTQKILKK